MKVVINKCWGGFGLSTDAVEWLMKNKNWKAVPEDSKKDGKITEWTHPDSIKMWGKYSANTYGIKRDDKDLVAVVEALGEKANSAHASLKIVKIPNGIKWEIDEYDGQESINEQYRSWG